MFALWSDPEVVKYSGSITDKGGKTIEMPAKKTDSSDLLIEFWDQAAKDQWGFRWALLLENEFIGTVGFNSVKKNYEIAFHLIPKYWKKGLMSEAAQVSLEWARLNGANGVQAYVEDENIASVKLCQTLGMTVTKKSVDGARQYLLKF